MSYESSSEGMSLDSPPAGTPDAEEEEVVEGGAEEPCGCAAALAVRVALSSALVSPLTKSLTCTADERYYMAKVSLTGEC